MEDERILLALHRIIELQEQLNDQLKSNQTAGNSTDTDWMEHQEVQKKFRVSRSTLYRHRKKKELIEKRFFGRINFFISDVFKVKKH